ncbi:MAG TPA: glycosyltransferase family 2 protein [Solirubrobacteraceae bacterium]|nr:glycosyltransferase family 2 protein [Solirubrobacteraceae bacterium]
MTRRRRPRRGGRPTVRFVVVAALTAAYVAFGVYVSAPWRSDLREAIGPVMAWVIPIMLAHIPGLLIGFMAITLLTLRYRVPPAQAPAGPWPAGEWPPVTVIVAAWNDEGAIVPTVERIAELTYAGPVEVVLADNNSTDRTAELAAQAAQRHGLNYRRVFEPVAGKHRALNTALESVTTPLVVTVDADTLLHPDALTYLIARVTSRPQDQHVCACAGALVVENASTNLLSRMQGWDYRLGINGVKRMQSAYNSALVAQGAFSAYWTDDVMAVGGWPDAIGEDIVLTWTLMDSRGIVQYEPCALGFTDAPERLAHFMRQRSRWARGMFESLRLNPPARQPRVLAKFVAGIDYLVPFLDIGYIFFWIPGVILFIFGYPLLFSWWSMLVIPVTLVIYGLLRRWQERNVFRRLDVHPGQDIRGFFGYLFGYQVLTSSASLRGYLQYLTGAARRWR